MIDHFTLSFVDLPGALSFYEKTLSSLGYSMLMAFEQYRGFGADGKPSFWIKHAETNTTPMHIAFVAPSRKHVDAFHAAALAAGASDDGAPGLRPDYHPNYYAAFVIDPSGHHLEAVTHRPDAPVKAPKPAPAAKKSAKKAAPAKKQAKKPAPKAKAKGKAKGKKK